MAFFHLFQVSFHLLMGYATHVHLFSCWHFWASSNNTPSGLIGETTTETDNRIKTMCAFGERWGCHATASTRVAKQLTVTRLNEDETKKKREEVTMMRASMDAEEKFIFHYDFFFHLLHRIHFITFYIYKHLWIFLVLTASMREILF